MDEMPHIRVLLVEDNPGDAALVQEFLSTGDTARFDLAQVDQLGDALPRLRRERFDVVLLDLGLPDSQGFDTFSRVYQNVREVPILVLTGLDDRRLSSLAVKQGAQDYLPKGKLTSDLLVRSVCYAIERHRLLDKVRNQANVDELTGLYNRQGLLSVLFRAACRQEVEMVLAYIDLDNLKWINDTLGHRAGDLALTATADILRDAFRDSDIIARMGGDEFAVLCVGATAASVPLLQERLTSALQAHNTQCGLGYELSLSMGMAHYDPQKPCSLQALLDRADNLMYGQKEAKRRKSQRIGSR